MLLDILDIPLLEPCPKDYQQENWLLDPEFYWEKVSRLSWEKLESFSEPRGSLWLNGFHTSNGTNDQIPLRQAATQTSSLKLIHVDEIRLRVFAPSQTFGTQRGAYKPDFTSAATIMPCGLPTLILSGTTSHEVTAFMTLPNVT